MPGGGRKSKIEVIGQCEKRTEIGIGEGEGTKTEYVVDVCEGDDFPAITMRRTATPLATVVSTRVRRKFCPEHPDHSPDESLRREGCSSVAKGASPVQIYQVFPHDSKEGNVRGVDEQPSIPTSHVALPHDNRLVRVQLSGPGNCTDN